MLPEWLFVGDALVCYTAILGCPCHWHTPLCTATQHNSPPNCTCELLPLQGTPYQNQLQIIHCDVMKAQVRGCRPAPPALLLVKRSCEQAGAGGVHFHS